MTAPALESVSFVVYGPPRPKERPRLGRGGRVYTPKRTRQYEYAIGFAGISGIANMSPRGVWSLDGVYRVTCTLVFASRRHPDSDNVLKAVLDGLEGVAYRNDRQVVECSCRMVLEGHGPQRTEVLLERIGDAPRKARRDA